MGFPTVPIVAKNGLLSWDVAVPPFLTGWSARLLMGGPRVVLAHTEQLSARSSEVHTVSSRSGAQFTLECYTVSIWRHRDPWTNQSCMISLEGWFTIQYLSESTHCSVPSCKNLAVQPRGWRTHCQKNVKHLGAMQKSELVVSELATWWFF